MKKSQSITELVANLRAVIEEDLKAYEAGERGRGGFRLLVYVKDVGVVVPFDWINFFPDWKDKWFKFIEGQSVIEAGVFIRDVERFLSLMEHNAQQIEQK